MACKTIQHVFIPNLKLFRLIKTELRAKEVGEFPVLWQNGLMGILLSTNNMVYVNSFIHMGLNNNMLSA